MTQVFTTPSLKYFCTTADFIKIPKVSDFSIWMAKKPSAVQTYGKTVILNRQ